MVNLVIWSSGYFGIGRRATLRTQVGSSRANRPPKDRATLDGLLQERRNFWSVHDAHPPHDFKPERAFVGFFDDDTQSSDELRARASVAGSASAPIVRGNLSINFNTLMANNIVRSFNASLCALISAAPW